VTNAISSVIIVGALIAVGLDLSQAGETGWLSKCFGFVAVILAAVNIFGGFLVTQRMLAVYKKTQPLEGHRHVSQYCGSSLRRLGGSIHPRAARAFLA